jgi:hypothetical protein
MATLTASLVIVGYAALVPVSRAAIYLKRGRQNAALLPPHPLDAQPAYRHFQRAADVDPLDPVPCVQQARWLVGTTAGPAPHHDALPLAVASLEQAIRRDPFKLSWQRMLMEVHRARAAAPGGTASDHAAAVESAERIVELYPNGPAGYVDLADCLAGAARASTAPDLMQRAIENYEFALTLDDQRLWWEELRRFSEDEQTDIRAKIAQAEAWVRNQTP